ncbi:MAG TPA: acetamidase/formamidase family protein [Ilumatobacteraceae bacterium]|nr:acetamidase/formamidase family protein [Ilumatobacteraceae bacterium]
MALDITARLAAPGSGARHDLSASPSNCYWGYIDRDQPPALKVASGDVITVEAVTHHAGDAPDYLMDDGIRAIWDAIPAAERGPGVHLLTGPIHVDGAEPGDTLVVRILDMAPRLAYGSNCAANWGLLYDIFQKERITIYGLGGHGPDGYGPDGYDPDGAAGHDWGSAGGFPASARPMFGFDFTARPLYDLPGVISPPDSAARSPFSVPVTVPVRPHFGVMGVAPAESGRHSSIPPGVWGGNVDNWRLGPGATMCYPVFVDGGLLYVGDPHFAQGDGEICGTAIEASLNATIQVSVVKGLGVQSPLMETGTHWLTHGFGADLDAATRMAAEQMLWLLQTHIGLTADDAYSLASVAMDLGVTQVVDRTVGCHASIARGIFA